MNVPNAAATSEESYERLVFGGQAFFAPKSITESEDIFLGVLCKNSWNSISSEHKEQLKKYLPIQQTEDETEDLIENLLDVNKGVFHFNHPLRECHRRLKADWYRADRPSRELQIRDNARLLYDHAIRKYYIQLLKRLLATRRKILEIAAATPHGEMPTFPPNISTMKKSTTTRRERIRKRAHKRAKLMIQECKQQTGETGFSSDEEEEPQSKHVITVSSASECTILIPNSKDLRLHQPLELDDLKVMLHECRSLKKLLPDHPVLELADINLEDVIERAGLSSMAERVGLPVKYPTLNKQESVQSAPATSKSSGSKKGAKNTPAPVPPATTVSA